MAAIALLYFGHFIVRLLRDIDGFFTRANAEYLLVPPALTLGLVPFLFLVAWWSRREQENLRERFRAGFDSVA